MLNLGDKVVLLKEYEPKTTNKNKEILIEGSIGTICDILSNDAVYVEFDQNEYHDFVQPLPTSILKKID